MGKRATPWNFPFSTLLLFDSVFVKKEKCPAKDVARITPHQSRKGDLNSEPPLCRIRTLRQVQFRFCRSPHSGASAYSREISFRRLYGNVPEEELDLIEFTASKMTQTCAGAPKIMRGELLNPSLSGGVFNDFPDDLRGHPVSPDFASLVDCPEHPTGTDMRRGRPCIYGPLHPKRNWNRTHMATLANEIRDYPVLLA